MPKLPLIALLAITTAPLSAVSPTVTTPYEVATAYVTQIGTIERDRQQSEDDQAANHGDMASCIRDNTTLSMDLSAFARIMNGYHLHTGTAEADEAPKDIAAFYDQKRTVMDQFTNICEAFIKGPTDGVDYSKFAAQAPKLTAMSDYADKSQMEAGAMLFMTLISNRPDSQNHLSHLNITREERDRLLKSIDIEFGSKLDAANPGRYVAIAQIYRDKLKEFRCLDDPWQ